ncbi:type II toxin-antitoxin system RelE/ParE family toxin [Mucilaginibacter ginsenosidivorans]|uniref:Type II toxin-antitoxin system RelE/ParE family toxin n=1 Tax=Mucilaginibacter ginsenosidivorans TaxID=398053 RepID=A0A5B8UY99_9SPHI|nr:type II toxin-antitoxin system RelE/ParE family toxin [Mucilaginibacter ginsenosidivorans]QEC63962.1 type II toxin-antitoxin system RelE/ParE family toxin [Mucilaginibacter ginsenosidivorans]
MGLTIFYTPRSKETLLSVYNFIKNEFGVIAAEKFSAKAEKTISLVAEHPFLFKASMIDENVRVGLIAKQTSLFYKITDTSITLLFFWDNRQEPFFTEKN